MKKFKKLKRIITSMSLLGAFGGLLVLPSIFSSNKASETKAVDVLVKSYDGSFIGSQYTSDLNTIVDVNVGYNITLYDDPTIVDRYNYVINLTFIDFTTYTSNNDSVVCLFDNGGNIQNYSTRSSVFIDHVYIHINSLYFQWSAGYVRCIGGISLYDSNNILIDSISINRLLNYFKYYVGGSQVTSGGNSYNRRLSSPLDVTDVVLFSNTQYIESIPSDNQYYINGYNTGYNEGYNNGFNAGYENGANDPASPIAGSSYENGYNAGLEQGYLNGTADLDAQVESSYSLGYSDGYEEGFDSNSTAVTIMSGIFQVALVPVNFFLGMFNFEILGINLAVFIQALFTVLVTILVFKLILGGKGGGE